MKYAIPLPMVAGALLTPTVWYAIESGNASDERTPIVGDAQYAALETSAKEIVAKDQNLQQAQAQLVALEQSQIGRNDPDTAAKISTLQAQNEESLKTVKNDFTAFTRQLLSSEGISEEDAISLGKMIEYNTRYAAFTYNYQTSIESKMARLDECQASANKKIADTEERISNTETCINEYGINKPFVLGLGSFFGFLGGAFSLLSSLMLFQGKIEDAYRNFEEEKKRLDALPAGENTDNTFTETKIRTRVIKPPV